MAVRIRPKRGGDKALAAFKKAIETAPDVMQDMSRQMAEETIGLIKDGFRSETDPYGQRWKPKQANDGRKTLSGKTSRLKGGWHVAKSSKSGFTVAPAVDYAAPHQTGTKDGRLVKRAMVPDERGIPPTWREAWRETVEETLIAHFSSAAGSSWMLGKLAGLKRRFNYKALIRKAAKAIAGE